MMFESDVQRGCPALVVHGTGPFRRREGAGLRPRDHRDLDQQRSNRPVRPHRHLGRRNSCQRGTNRKTPIRIPLEASNIHGIYNEDIRDKPPLSEVAEELAELIDGAILVGHNVRSFDYAMLKTEFLRMGRLAPQPKAIMDTLELVRRLKLPRPHRLGAMCQRYGIRLEAAHTAAADAAATMLLFWRLSVEHAGAFRRPLPELERWIAHGDSAKDASELGRGLDDLVPVDSMGKVREDGNELVLAFGRHRGRYVREIQANDPSYIGWLLSPKGLDCQDTQARIKEHLRS